MDMKFHEEGERLWFSQNLVFGVIQKHSDDKFLLYKQGVESFYDFTGLQFNDWKEIEDYLNALDKN